MDMAGNFTSVQTVTTGSYGRFNGGIYERTRAAMLGDWTAYTPVVTQSAGAFTVGANYGSGVATGAPVSIASRLKTARWGTLLGSGTLHLTPVPLVGTGLVADCAIRLYIGWAGISEVGFEKLPRATRLVWWRTLQRGRVSCRIGAAFYARGTIIYRIS
jgi:hypothetical protein